MSVGQGRVTVRRGYRSINRRFKDAMRLALQNGGRAHEKREDGVFEKLDKAKKWILPYNLKTE